MASLGSTAVGSCCDAAIDKGLKALALVISLLCDLEQASLPLFRSFIGLFAYEILFLSFERRDSVSFNFFFLKQIIIYIQKWTSVNV